MALWICTACGSAENLTFYPDCCSSCGGSMETQDGRNTLSAGLGEEADYWERLESAWNDGPNEDEAAIIRMWQRGRPLSNAQQRVLDDLRLTNSITAIGAIFGGVAA